MAKKVLKKNKQWMKKGVKKGAPGDMEMKMKMMSPEEMEQHKKERMGKKKPLANVFKKAAAKRKKK